MKNYDNHVVSESILVIDALKRINSIAPDPLVLFVVDEKNGMVGTLTDGDVRRALIAGYGLQDCIEKVMHRNFNYIRSDFGDMVAELHRQRELKMTLVPVLDAENRIVDIINLNAVITQLPIDAVMMAGGKGVRLRPLTETTPKPLLKVGGKSIIDYNVERLVRYGAKHISVTVNYLREQLEEHFKSPIMDIQVNTVREPEYLGTMGSIQFVPKFYNDTILVMNSDLFTNIDYENFYLHFKKHDADMSVAAVPYTVNVPFGIFNLEGREIKGVKEKPVYNYFANAGIYLIKRDLFESMPKNKFYNATDFLNDAVSAGRKVVRFPISGYWIDIGSPAEYEKANELVKHI